jgi:hypothetical protein
MYFCSINEKWKEQTKEKNKDEVTVALELRLHVLTGRCKEKGATLHYL